MIKTKSRNTVFYSSFFC